MPRARMKHREDRPEFTPGYFRRKGWGTITRELQDFVLERDGHLCGGCGDYTDGNEVVHHMVYRKRRDGGPWPAQAEDLRTWHNAPGVICEGQKDLPWVVVIEDEFVDTSNDLL